MLLPGANALLFVAEQEVPIGLASLVIASVPLLVVALRFAGGERPTRGSLVGVAIGFVGIAVLVRPGGGASTTGLALVVGSAVAWAVGSYLSGRLPMPRDAFAATALEMLVGGLVLLPIGLLATDFDPSEWSTRSILGWWYLVLFGSLVGYTAYVWLLQNAPISKVATYAYVNPVVAIALGAVVLHEEITWRIGWVRRSCWRLWQLSSGGSPCPRRPKRRRQAPDACRTRPRERCRRAAPECAPAPGRSRRAVPTRPPRRRPRSAARPRP